MVSDVKYQELLAKQLAMNGKTLERLVINGLKDDTEVQLDFFYYGQDEEAGQRFVDFLLKESGYNAAIAKDDDGWAVTGKTKNTRVTKEILDRWVDWMIIAGLKYDFEFDGWGTVVG